ncbi:MAG TPA: ribonuclease III [Nitrospirota bacterium]|nr:ribonuclease III [Nitrospirota bacterium]
MSSLADIEARISFRFSDKELLERALTHKSYANENRVPSHNERLEFLGDAVLNLVISEYLMNNCPDSTEGDLSRLRAAVVSEPALSMIARHIGLGEYLLLGKGEEQTGGRDKDSLLADSLEALIAALYLDGGHAVVAEFVIRFFEDLIKKSCASRGTLDYKTELQELCQERLRTLPDYRIVSETGPDHRKEFTVELSIRGDVRGRGTGRSKKDAEQKAAKEALSSFRENP